MPKKNSLKNVLIIQRAIPHYRLPLFKKLNNSSLFNLFFCVGIHDIKTATGIATSDYDNLKIKEANVYRLFGNILFQKIISLKEIDIIITDISINLLSLPVYLIYAKLVKIKIIGWGKGIPQNLEKKENIIKKSYKKLYINLCDKLLLYGNVSKDYLIGLGIKSDKFIIAQNTIDTLSLIQKSPIFKDYAIKMRIELGLKDKFVFGYFGKLSKRKKVDHIIYAFIELKEFTSSNDVLVIAGDGLEKDYLKEIAEKSKFAESIIFLGTVEIGNEGKIIQLFDAYLSFSQAGLGILEAMALSKLIVSTPEMYPETELLENNFNCLLSKDFTIKSFLKAMMKARSLKDERIALELNAKKTVKEKATIENMVKAFEEAIKSV